MDGITPRSAASSAATAEPESAGARAARERSARKGQSIALAAKGERGVTSDRVTKADRVTSVLHQPGPGGGRVAVARGGTTPRVTLHHSHMLLVDTTEGAGHGYEAASLVSKAAAGRRVAGILDKMASEDLAMVVKTSASTAEPILDDKFFSGMKAHFDQMATDQTAALQTKLNVGLPTIMQQFGVRHIGGEGNQLRAPKR